MKIPKMFELQPPSLGTTSLFLLFSRAILLKTTPLALASLVTLKPVNATMAEESASGRVATPAEWMVFRVLIHQSLRVQTAPKLEDAGN